MTQSAGSTGGQTYPVQAVAALNYPVTSFNYGFSGKRLETMLTDAPSLVDNKYISGYKAPQIVILWGGVNDFGDPARTPAQVYQDMKTYGTARKALGFKVIILSMLPSNYGGFPIDYEVARQEVNTSLRADFPTATAFTNIYTGGSYADVLVDNGNDSIIGIFNAPAINPSYFSDVTHLTNIGYAIIADYVVKAFTLITWP